MNTSCLKRINKIDLDYVLHSMVDLLSITNANVKPRYTLLLELLVLL